jgi:sec-independent protein translocase protein TatA
MGLDNPLHIAFLLVIMLLVFGAKRLPEMGRSLGEGLRGFKGAINGEPTTTAITAARVTTPDPQSMEHAHSASEAAPSPLARS